MGIDKDPEKMMQHYFAYLRAINVGGHTVKMDLLRQHFEALGLLNVETFIASGNVIFEEDCDDVAALEVLIEETLIERLGYPVATFLRSPQELVRIAAYQPFTAEVFGSAAAFNVAFLKSPLDETAAGRLAALENEIDRFHVEGREMYWLCQVRQSQSKFSNAVLEKVLGQPTTLRNVNTIKKMVEKYT